MKKFAKNLIAPCGMNCGLCQNYLRAENKCPGCFSGRKVNGRLIKCGRRLCQKRQDDFCLPRAESRGDCIEFPCDSIQRLDKRYREKYGMSMIENLKFIKENGIDKFLDDQTNKYISNQGVYCVHDKKIYKGEK